MIFLPLALVLWNAPPTTLTLDLALARALEANPALAGSVAQVDAAAARRRATFSLVLPKISATGNYRFNSDEASFGSGPGERPILPSEDWQTRLNLRQPIYAGRRELRSYQQSGVAVEQAESTVADLRQQLIFSVVADALALLEAEDQIEVEGKNLELVRARRQQADDFFAVGEVTEVEVLRAESAIKAAERQLVLARGSREKAVGRLRRSLALEGEINLLAHGALVPLLPPEQVLLVEAQSRPMLEQARLGVEIAELEVKKQRGASLPVIFLEGSWIEQRSAFPTDSYGFLALNVDVPIFQGGELRARVAEAEAKREAARRQLEDLERAVSEEVRAALVDVGTAEELALLSEQELKVAERAHAQAFELYRAQESSALDLEVSEQSLIEARRRVTGAARAVERARLTVLATAGLLESTFLSGGGSR
jgi:outer membrane protein